MNKPEKIRSPEHGTPAINKPKTLLRKLIIPSLVIGFVIVMIYSMPRGYSTDLTRIGAGGNVIVQVFDHNLVRSQNLMRSFDEIRSDHEDRIEFLLADVNQASGKEFAAQYNVSTVTVVFFDSRGNILAKQQGVQTPEMLRKSIIQYFGN